eukprot:gene6038-6651_t
MSVINHAVLENLESGKQIDYAHPTLNQNPNYIYYQQAEKLHGFLSRQYPTIANPAPLGLCAFGMTTFVISMYNAGAIIDLRSPTQGAGMGMCMFYGGLIQLLAGMWEFKTGNTIGALLFSSYGGFWLSYSALYVSAFGFMTGYAYADAQVKNDALGIFLLSWSIFSFLWMIAMHRTTLALMFLLWLVGMTTLLLAIGEFKENDLYLKRAGGIFGIIGAGAAWYGAMATYMTKKNSFIVLPLGEMDPIYKRLGWLVDEPEEEENVKGK